jgi:uncharacterized protein YjbJ (UPF0337 family)
MGHGGVVPDRTGNIHGGTRVTWKTQRKDAEMDRNRIEGKVQKVKGSIKETAGKLLGNDRLRAEGQGDKLKGSIKVAAGKTADAVRKGFGKASGAVRGASKH